VIRLDRIVRFNLAEQAALDERSETRFTSPEDRSRMAFHGRVALVTGGGSGMGRIYARRMADAGAQVAIVDINEAGLAETRDGRPNLHPYVADVTDAARIAEVVAAVEGVHGALDRVVHAAAIMPASPVLADDPARVKRLMTVNYEGTVNLIYATVPAMVARGRGDFIVFSSVAAYALTPNLGAYCASKAAISALVEVLIRENEGSGVRIHLTCPPMVDTPLLRQALDTTPPRSLQKGLDRKLAADPHDVVDAIEKAIDKGQTISFPSRMARGLYGLRRLSPALLWRVILREERA
jgi:NAD(P)-dependent dehydrogenase (short-subunit alcohol dehydrogenase family)